MRYYSFVDQPEGENDYDVLKTIYSEVEILEEFWIHWSNEMKGNGFGHMLNRETCIEDWCTIHWATREDIYKFKSGYEGKDFIINEFNLQDPTFNLATVICLNDNSVVINRYVNIGLEMERADV